MIRELTKVDHEQVLTFLKKEAAITGNSQITLSNSNLILPMIILKKASSAPNS